MMVKRASEQEWISAGYEGAQRALLRVSKTSGRTSIVRLKAGARGPTHTHQAGEDLLVLSGKIRIANQTLGPGDYLYTDAGEAHQLEALEDSVVYASTDKPIDIVS
jgi:quercetin dioxygenase-like cupin family protein